MKCPFCGYTESKVTDSRPTEDFLKIRRRRECIQCGGRFTTYEIIEHTPLMVVKKDKSRQLFNRDKLLNGLMRACEKRPVSREKLESIVDHLEYTYSNALNKEITSSELGDQVLAQLREIDDVAYIRFASVYRDFSDVTSFLQELKQMEKVRK